MGKVLIGIIAGLCLVLAAPAVAQADQGATDPKASDLALAKKALKEGKAEQAISLVDPIIAKALADDAKDPEAACPGMAAAILASFMGKAGSNVTITVENDWCEAMLVRGYALGELKRFDESAEIMGKLIGHDQDNANYRAEYAYALLMGGKLDLAFEQYQKLKQAASKYSDKATKRHWRAVALRGIGYVEFERARWDFAEKAYRDSLKEEPGNSVALSELELIKKKRGQ